MGKLRDLKDKLFYAAVERNPYILKEYQEYKWKIGDRKENKLKSWSYLLNLNFRYRLLRIQNRKWYNANWDNHGKSKGKRKLPYLNGAESEIIDRSTANQFGKILTTYDIISFDVLDTLILRPFSKPSDLFMIVGEKLNVLNFKSVRVEAEKEARKIAMVKKGNHEVTIHDIYDIVEFKTGIDRDYGVQVEFETEMEFCFANPYMKVVFDILKTQKKQMIAVSDMYLTKPMMTKLLEKCGFTGFSKIYVSSEHNASKRDKQLYKIVLNELPNNKTIVHIGDNFQTDIIHAREMGVNTKFYKNVHEAGREFRADGMSELIGSAYSGIVNTHLHNGLRKYTPHYEYGFIYGGLYVLGYCNWIHEYAKQNNIDKVLFLSRDGEIYQKIFNYLFDDVENEYVYWSRIANTKYTVDFNRYDFITRIVNQKAKGLAEISIGMLLKSLELEVLSGRLDQYGLSYTEIVHEGNMKTIERFFVENWEQVVTTLTSDREIVKEYFSNIIKDAKKVAVVDVGWLGTGGLGIKKLIEETWQFNCEVKCLLAASRKSEHEANSHFIMKKDIEVYIFSRFYNRIHYDFHANTNKNTNNIYFELFTQAQYPSFAGFKKTENGFDFVFDVPEVENYKMIEEVHKGIYDFVKGYNETFKNHNYMLNVSGYDAYLPFRMIIKDLKYIKRYFGDFRYARTVIGDYENQSVETLRDIMESRGL